MLIFNRIYCTNRPSPAPLAIITAEPTDDIDYFTGKVEIITELALHSFLIELFCIYATARSFRRFMSVSVARSNCPSIQKIAKCFEDLIGNFGKGCCLISGKRFTIEPKLNKTFWHCRHKFSDCSLKIIFCGFLELNERSFDI